MDSAPGTAAFTPAQQSTGSGSDRSESWTPTTHTVSEHGRTKVDIFADPVFKRDSAGWTSVDETITAGGGRYPFEALGLINPVHFGTSADALVVLDTARGPVSIGLKGAHVEPPTLAEQVVTYANVFPGVDLEFRTDGGRVGKHLVIADAAASRTFTFSIADPGHLLGTPTKRDDESWVFDEPIAFDTLLQLPAPAAWSTTDAGAPTDGTAHQQVTRTRQGYDVELTLDARWSAGAAFPVVLDPAVEWVEPTDERWFDGEGLQVAFGPSGATDCSGSPCRLAAPVDGVTKIGPFGASDGGVDAHYLTYVGADVATLRGRLVTRATIGSTQDYNILPMAYAVCTVMRPRNTGADLAAARCGDRLASRRWTSDGWSVDVLDQVRAAIRPGGPSGTRIGVALGPELFNGIILDDATPIPEGDYGARLHRPYLHLEYLGYPVPRPLSLGQTFGCACWAGGSTGNQRLAADPVNTATGALMEHFSDLSVPGLGVPGYTYDEDGLLVEQSNPDGGTQRFTYTDGTGGTPARLLATSTDPLGRTTTYTYDAAGDLVAVRQPSGRTTTSTYDQAHRRLSSTSPGGLVTSWTYDAAGRVLTSTDPGGAVSANTYDDGGRLVATTDPAGHVTRYVYDRADRLLRTTRAGRTSSATYDDAGRMTRSTDPTGATTQYSYDELGRVSTETDATGAVTTFAYDAAGNLLTSTNPAGAITSYEYDLLGRQTQVTDPDGITTQTSYNRRGDVTTVGPQGGAVEWFGYDAMGRPTVHVDQDYVATQYEYDAAGQLTATVTPRGASYFDPDYDPNYLSERTTYTYDLDGNLTATTDPRGNAPGAEPEAFTSRTRYDTEGRPVATTDALGRTTTTRYDAMSRPTRVVDPSGAISRTRYDILGRVRSVTDPTGAITRYAYDAAGDMVRRTDALGHVTSYEYDAAGREVRQSDPLGHVTTTVYDPAGRVVQVVKPSGNTTDTAGDGTTDLAYDAAGRLTTMSFSDATPDYTYVYSPGGRTLRAARSLAGTETFAESYTYDYLGHISTATRSGYAAGKTTYGFTFAGRLSRVRWPNGTELRYGYNDAGLLASTQPYGIGLNAVDYRYDALGNVTAVTRQGSSPVTTTSTYDAASQLTSLTHSIGGAPALSYTIDRDARRLPTQVHTTRGDSAVDTGVFGYDQAGRLSTECYPTTGTTCASSDPQKAYTYDAVGNRTALTSTSSVDGATSTSATEYTYNAADQLTSQRTDAGPEISSTWTVDGQLASSTDPDGTRTMSYDLAGELTQLTLETGDKVGYEVDTSGNRITRTWNGATDASWTWDDVIGLPFRTNEYGPEGQFVNQWVPDPTSSVVGSIAAGEDGADLSWTLTDPFSSVTGAVAVGADELTGSQRLDPFGEADGPGTVPATGFFTDEPTGFHSQYLDARTGMYDMRARDYLASSGQFTSIDPLVDQTRKPYQYGNNNPLAFVDPTGLVSCGPMDSGDCNGRNLLPLLNHMSKVYDDAGYIAVVNGMSKEQRDEIGYDEMTYVNREVVNRQTHMQVCSDQGGCWAPCPEQGYNRCQLGRGAIMLVGFVGEQLGGMVFASLLSRACATNTARVDIAGARFAQKDFRESFSNGDGALFWGRTIDEVAESLRSGAMSPKDVPIDVIVREGNTLILNTRSSQALIRAGIPRSSWNVINRTGQAAFEARLDGQLSRNGLTSYGTDLP
ncbi:RHS repeat-associated core domain-containing protein [Cellulomonas chitinilytica]|uniref:RHS repeat-associated core domain-containing protein n=1 Tax=Cellulomonas chitinilytica TaxID=398759 RepID=UPI00194140DA|nr:RHS repeat-associated core domain-containing protein [Cellulomonas chitinilytica]